MDEQTLKKVVGALMIIAVISLIIFIYFQISYQQNITELLKNCNYQDICNQCLGDRISGISNYNITGG
jgi:hypothetical protein